MSRVFTLLAAATVTTSCSSSLPPAPTTAPPGTAVFPDGELVDLSHTYDEKTIFWPTSDRFRLEKITNNITPDGYYYAANNFFTAEHGNTHLNTPIHFKKNKKPVDRIPLTHFFGRTVVIDVSDRAKHDPNYQVTTDDIMQTEQHDDAISNDAVVLIRTNFSTQWPNAERYMGTAERGQQTMAKLHFPDLHPDTARWLVANRPVKTISIDTANIDYGQSKLFESHQILFAADIPAFENLNALERLPARGAFIVALPMKIGGESGAPLRAVTILPRAATP